MRTFAIVALLALGAAMTGCGMEQVDEGYRGIHTRFGKVSGEALSPGMHFFNPFTADIFEMEVREQKIEGQTTAFTRDTQNVMVTFAITYYPKPEKIHAIYSQFGRNYADKVLLPAVLGSVKDVIGQYIADDLVSKREAAKKAIQHELTEALASRDITVTRLDLTNLDFDDAYERAVEEKVVAVQNAAKAKNRTIEVQEKAKQAVISAEADAKAMRIKSQALSQNKGLVQYEAIQKWNGELPKFMFGNSVPMINFDKIKQE